MDATTCAVCHRSFRYTEIKGQPVPEICGQVYCRARHEWTDEDWAGKARMARAREKARIALNDVDREALRRADDTGTPVSRGTSFDYDDQGKQESAPAQLGTAGGRPEPIRGGPT